ncbi:MAG: citramalate synthase [Actinobacteria bacterium]|nr:citramalate synthase [Actinomycetota bacterium]
MPNLILYDTTLRDGAQREGVSYSADDKLRIAQRLDAYGMHYIEGGFPGSNAKDREFFSRAAGIAWRHAKLTAFGATRYKDRPVESDGGVRALVDCATPAVTIVAKFSRFQVETILETRLDENLAMIRDTVRHLKAAGREVLVDAEHFFDGFRDDRAYSAQCVRAASEAGADWLVLCDTNGGSLPDFVREATQAVRGWTRLRLGIHTHNDMDLGVANTLAGVQGGATQIQGTINGYGERCGNANLSALIPTLQLKLGYACVSAAQLRQTTQLSRYVSEIANVAPDPHMAYVGHSAFAHKAGYHGSGMRKDAAAYQHTDPQHVGNEPRILVSELAGRSNIAAKVAELGLAASDAQAARVLDSVKQLEERGFQFEGAEASFELLVRRQADGYRPPFEFVDFLVLAETRQGREMLSEAMVKIRVGDETFHTAAEGNGPVSALDHAARKALERFFPALARMRLTDYKVRILETGAATDAGVRVLIESTDGTREWGTVGSSTNIIEASWLALKDSYEFALLVSQPAGTPA